MTLKTSIIACILTLLCAGSTLADNTAYGFEVTNMEIISGESALLPVAMFNETAVIGFQFDVLLPEGIELAKNSSNEYYLEGSSRFAGHQVSADDVDGVVRFVVVSLKNNEFVGNDGTLFSLPLIVSGETRTTSIALGNIKLSTVTHTQVNCPAVTAIITVNEPEMNRYGENQFYVKDITINEGENATLRIGYNILTDFYEYTASILLPVGVSVGDVTFTADEDIFSSYTNTASFSAPTLEIAGEPSTRKGFASQGDNIFATAPLETSALAAGVYQIIVTDQSIENDDETLHPADYVAYLTVKAVATTPCEAPVIDLDASGNLVVTCATPSAQIHTSIVAADHQELDHVSGHIIPLAGQYIVTSYATAPGYAKSEPTSAAIVWTKGAQATPTDLDEISTEFERAVLLRTGSDWVEIVGTLAGEELGIYNLNGQSRYIGYTTNGSTKVTMAFTPGQVYVIVLGTHTFKIKF